MYSWGDDTSDWATPGVYKFDAGSAKARDADAERAAASGPRTYHDKGRPNTQLTDPKKMISSASKDPLVVAVDVTGSMQTWPREIFDRLPLLYNTLMQYRPDLEISFAAIGDGACDRWPLQATRFAKGFDLEENLKGIYGEGGGGDQPESYGLFAQWVRTHVTTTVAERPFLIVFGDAPMHAKTPAAQIEGILGDEAKGDVDSIAAWQEVAQKWNTWFLRRPGEKKGDAIDDQWAKAIGVQQVVHMEDEQRAVDYAMGLVARAWGHFGDFKTNMAARQDGTKVDQLADQIKGKIRVLSCPKCSAPVPPEARGAFACKFCGTTLTLD
jgi:hypothetical protein